MPLRAQLGLTLNGGDWSVGFVQVGFRIATMKQIEEPLPFRLGDAFRDGLTGRVWRDGGTSRSSRGRIEARCCVARKASLSAQSGLAWISERALAQSHFGS